MAEFIAFGAGFMDYDSTMDEIEVLIPKYLEAIDCLEGVDVTEDLPLALKNVEVYWDRLTTLFMQVRTLDTGMQLKEIVSNSLRAELRILEKVYLGLNQRLMRPKQEWSEMLFRSAELILLRMDRVLAGLGFREGDEDRSFVAKLMAKTMNQRRQMLAG